MTARVIVPPPVAIEEHTLLIIVVLMILGGMMLGAILYAVHCAGLRTPRIERTSWLTLLGFAIILIALTRPGSNAGYVSPADRVVLQPVPTPTRPTTRLTIDTTTDCGPRADGHTDQIVFTIESRADANPVVTGCTRIAERSFAIKTLQVAQ